MGLPAVVSSLHEPTGALQLWTDRPSTTGNNRKGRANKNLERADLLLLLLLLLLSADFMNSDYCFDIELKRALKRHEAVEACAVPVIVRKVAWRSAPFGKLQALPANGEVVDQGTGSRSARDAAWSAVAEGLEKALKELATSRQ